MPAAPPPTLPPPALGFLQTSALPTLCLPVPAPSSCPIHQGIGDQWWGNEARLAWSMQGSWGKSGARVPQLQPMGREAGLHPARLAPRPLVPGCAWVCVHHCIPLIPQPCQATAGRGRLRGARRGLVPVARKEGWPGAVRPGDVPSWGLSPGAPCLHRTRTVPAAVLRLEVRTVPLGQVPSLARVGPEGSNPS